MAPGGITKHFEAPSTRIRTFFDPYFWIHSFFSPERASVHTHPVNSVANSDIFKTTPQSGKYINPQRITCGWVNPDILESDDVANSCPVSYRTMTQYGGTTTTTGHISRHYRTLYGACSEHILLQRSPGYLSESGYHRMRVDGRIGHFRVLLCLCLKTSLSAKMSSACSFISCKSKSFHKNGFALRLALKQRHKGTRKWPIRFEYASCGRRNFWIRKRKLQIQKYPDTCGRGLREIAESLRKPRQQRQR